MIRRMGNVVAPARSIGWCWREQGVKVQSLILPRAVYSVVRVGYL